MSTCKACGRSFDNEAFPVEETGFCSVCARSILDWFNEAILAGIIERGEDPGVELLEPEKYYYVRIYWYGTKQMHVEYTIDGEADGPGNGRSEGIFSGLELAVQMDMTNRFNEIEMASYICCNSGAVIAFNDICPQW